MPFTNKWFDEYLEEKVKAGKSNEPIKRNWKKPNSFVDEQVCLVLDTPKKLKVEKVKPKKYYLDADSDDDLCQLKSKHCTSCKRFGNLD